MTLDWDGRIRMDPSSPYAMQRLIAHQGPLRRRVRLRHRPRPARHRHAAAPACCRPTTTSRCAIDYLFRHRPEWRSDAAVGKTVVSSAMIDRVAKRARPQAVRGAGRLQVVRRRPARRLARASAARRAPARRSCAATARCGPPTRTASCRRCSRPRSPRAPGAIPAMLYRRSDARRSAHPSPTASMRRPRPRRRAGSRSCRRNHDPLDRARPASRSTADARSRAGQRRADRRHQGRQPPTAGSRRGRRAPRTSTRSTPRAFATRTHSAESARRGADDRRSRLSPTRADEALHRRKATMPDELDALCINTIRFLVGGRGAEGATAAIRACRSARRRWPTCCGRAS